MDEITKISNIEKISRLINDKNLLKNYLSISYTTHIDDVLGMIVSRTSTFGFDSKCFEKYKKDEEEFFNFLECPDVKEGMFQCFKCKSKKIFTMSKQTRRGDESTTVFARCFNCKNGWIIN